MNQEPVVKIITGGIALLNAVLALLFTFVSFTAEQVAAVWGVSNALSAFLLSLLVRSKVTPTPPNT